MNFIFPKNYDFSFKFLGIFSYFSILILIIWSTLLYFILSFFLHSFIVKLYIFIILFIPVFLFSVLNKSNENILVIISYIIKYIVHPKVYFYDKRFD